MSNPFRNKQTEKFVHVPRTAEYRNAMTALRCTQNRKKNIKDY